MYVLYTHMVQPLSERAFEPQRAATKRKEKREIKGEISNQSTHQGIDMYENSKIPLSYHVSQSKEKFSFFQPESSWRHIL